MMDWFEWNFSFYNIEKGKDMLSYGPPGLFQKAMESLSSRLGIRNIHITNNNLGDLKKLFSNQKIKHDIARQVYEKDIRPILKSEGNIGIIVALGPILCQVDLEDADEGTSFFIGGFGVDENDYDILKQKFDGRELKEFYGNIFWTWAFSPGKNGYSRNFFPAYPYIFFDVADTSDNSRLLDYNELGQVIATRFTRDMIFRWKERDTAILIKPQGQFGWNGVGDVGPLI